MRFRVSRHAEWEVNRRGIPLKMIEAVADHPEQRIPERPGVWICQSRVRFGDGRIYLLRVVVAEDEDLPVIVTAYGASKIEKYWRPE